jgi:hypothetical protein
MTTESRSSKFRNSAPSLFPLLKFNSGNNERELIEMLHYFIFGGGREGGNDEPPK